MKSKAPWHISMSDPRIILGNRGDFVSVVANSYVKDDAPLIAAAPALLEALQNLVNFILESVPEPHNPRIIAAISALKKAEGL